MTDEPVKLSRAEISQLVMAMAAVSGAFLELAKLVRSDTEAHSKILGSIDTVLNAAKMLQDKVAVGGARE